MESEANNTDMHTSNGSKKLSSLPSEKLQSQKTVIDSIQDYSNLVEFVMREDKSY